MSEDPAIRPGARWPTGDCKCCGETFKAESTGDIGDDYACPTFYALDSEGFCDGCRDEYACPDCGAMEDTTNPENRCHQCHAEHMQAESIADARENR
jgi:hypothetical protein